jgi:tetratricopeptide (TPR) repeat protein
MCCVFSLAFCAESDWKDFWYKGITYFHQEQYQEASLEFDQAVLLMSEEDLDLHPYVLTYRADANYQLRNYSRVLRDTEIALRSKHLTDYERFVCGSKRVGAFNILGNEKAAVKEYKKYIVDCPLFPKKEFSKDKITIRNMPDSECYKEAERMYLREEYCEKDEDIHEYHNMWIVDITKQKRTSSSQP